MAYGQRARKRNRSSRYSKRRMGYKRRAPRLRSSTYKAVKRVAYRVLQKNTETKYNDLSNSTAVSVDWNATNTALDCMANIVEGDGAESRRTGNKISCKGLGVRIVLAGNTASNVSMTHFRVVVVRWHNENGNAPGISNLIAGSNFKRFMAPYYFVPNKNWTIIDDTFVTVGALSTATAPTGQPTRYFYNKFFKLNHVCTFDPTSNLIQDGGVYVFIISDADPSYTFKPTANYETRLYYKDD